MTHINPFLQQRGFRGFEDDGVPGTAIAAENTNWSQSVDVNFRVRFEVEERDGGTESNANLRLQYNLEAAGWVDVSDVSSVVKSFASPQYADEDNDSVDRLATSAKAFLIGKLDENGLAGSLNDIDFAGNDHAEVEYCLQIVSADVANNDTIELRVRREGGALDAWPDPLPSITVVEGAGPQTISPTGIASTLAIGAIQQLARTLEGLTGIASTEAHGSSQLNLKAEPSGIASGLAFGTATMQPGPVTISPVGIASALAFGTPTMQPGSVTVSPSGIASTLAFGTPTVTVAALTISPSGIASGVAFGTAGLDQQVTPAGIAGGLVFGTPSVAALISPAGIASSIAFGAAQLNQEITPAGIASAAAVGEPTMQPGSVTVSPSGIASTLAFGSPTMTASIEPSGIASTLAFGTAAMQPGPVTISPGGIASSLGIGSLTVSVPMTIRPDGISSTVAFGTTTVSIDVRGVLTGYVELAVSLAGTVAFATVLVGKAE